MANFFVLFNKELKGHLRTYRLPVLVAIFFVFGVATPLLFKYLPVLLQLSGENIAIQFPEFTATDVVKEHIDTLGQVGLIAAILVAMGSVARERELGTAAMTLSKPVGCGAFVTAKVAALGLIFGIGIAVATIGCYIYTVILFGDPSALNFFVANLVAGLYLLVCLAVTVMYSCIFKSQLAAGGLALVSLIVLSLVSGFLPVTRDYGPGALLAWSLRIALGGGPSAWGALIASTGLVTLTTIIGWQAFQRKEL